MLIFVQNNTCRQYIRFYKITKINYDTNLLLVFHKSNYQLYEKIHFKYYYIKQIIIHMMSNSITSFFLLFKRLSYNLNILLNYY